MRRKLLPLLCFGVMLLLQNQQAESVASLDNLENVKMLTAENFDKELSKRNLFVLFYGSECPQCDKLALTWKELVENINIDDSPRKKHKNHFVEASPGTSIVKANCNNDARLCSNKCSIYEYRKCKDGPDIYCNLDGEYHPRQWMETLDDAKNSCDQQPKFK